MSGLEACISGKPVITCGYASYGGLGFTLEAYDGQSLDYQLQRIMNDDYQVDAYSHGDAMKFFHIYMNLYCVTKTESELVKLLAG
jgi:hypothetical protein